MRYQKKKSYIVEIPYETVAETAKDGEAKIKTIFEAFGCKNVSVKYVRDKRTSQQNRALHLWFTQLAEELNAAGFDMRKTISKDIDISWTPETIKEYLWRPVQKAYLMKRSTTELTTSDIDHIFDIVNLVISERTGVSVAFPSIDNLVN